MHTNVNITGNIIKTIWTWYSVDMNQCTKSPEKKLTITAMKFGIFVNKQKIYILLKGPFHDLQHHPHIFLKRKLRFSHQQKPLGIYCLCAKYFVQIHLFDEKTKKNKNKTNTIKLSIYYVSIIITNMWPMQHYDIVKHA